MNAGLKRVFTAAAVCTCAFAACIALSAAPAQAATYKACVGVGDKVKIGSSSFSLKQYYDGNYYCKIIRKKSGRSKVVATKADATFVTNGKYLYYSKVSRRTNRDGVEWQTVYRKNLKTGKQKKIVAGWGYQACACSGKYLYCGGTKEGADAGLKLYAINVKTKKKTFMRNGAGKVQYKNGKVIAATNSGDAWNYPLYVFNKNGKGRKLFAKGMTASIKGKRIYYCKMSSNASMFRVYSCNFKGKSKKAVTGWLYDYPSRYFD